MIDPDRIYIKAVAIKTGDLILTMPAPARHHNIFRAMGATGADMPLRDEVQGFLTSNGEFVNRFQAMSIARTAGQLLHPKSREFSKELYSEDVW